jgi:hypothetical protein
MTKHSRTKTAPNPHQSSELTHNYLKRISKIVSAVITVGVLLSFGVWVVVLWYQTSQVATSILLLPTQLDSVTQTPNYVLLTKIDSTKPSVQSFVLTEPKLLASVSAIVAAKNEEKIDKKEKIRISLALGTVIEHILSVPTLPAADPTLSQIKAGIWLAIKAWWGQWSWLERHHWLQAWGAASNVSDVAVVTKTIEQELGWSATLQQFASGEVSRECAVAVVNTTAQNGVARQITQVLEQSGLYVIRVTDNFSESPETVLVFNPEFACARELSILGSLVPHQLSPVANGEVARKYRADAVLLIGVDLAELVVPKPE